MVDRDQNQMTPGESEKDRVRYTLDLSPCDQATVDASVVAWSPLKIEIRAWHDRLAWLELLMDNKHGRGEMDAFASIANDYMALADSLTRESIYLLVDRLRQKQRRILHATATIIAVSTLLYFWLPLLGIVIDVTGVLAMLFWYRLLEGRQSRLAEFLDSLQQNAPERRRQFRQARLTWYCELSEAKNA